MNYDPQRHHRHSIRLPGYDYAGVGVIFITVCTYQRENLFAEIIAESIVRNSVGNIVNTTWQDLPRRFPDLILDAFVVMPNHIHGILIFPDQPINSAPPFPPAALGHVLRAFKSISAVASNRFLERHEWPLWQRGYYEHVVRNELVLDKARSYIDNNPKNWHRDADNPVFL